MEKVSYHCASHAPALITTNLHVKSEIRAIVIEVL